MTPDPTLARIASPLPEEIPDWPRLEADSSLRSAARVAAEAGSDGIVLMRDGKPQRLVTVPAILHALSLDIDALTGLPRSGALRDWLAERLREGIEVSVVFLDLDSFGEINKAYGHTEGDAVLARVADAIRVASTEQEFPARFGGDEFAMGSLRNRGGANEFADMIRKALRAEGIQASAGVSGGRRVEVRDNVNIGATVEELLRLASFECMRSKESGP